MDNDDNKSNIYKAFKDLTELKRVHRRIHRFSSSNPSLGDLSNQRKVSQSNKIDILAQYIISLKKLSDADFRLLSTNQSYIDIVNNNEKLKKLFFRISDYMGNLEEFGFNLVNAFRQEINDIIDNGHIADIGNVENIEDIMKIYYRITNTLIIDILTEFYELNVALDDTTPITLDGIIEFTRENGGIIGFFINLIAYRNNIAVYKILDKNIPLFDQLLVDSHIHINNIVRAIGTTNIDIYNILIERGIIRQILRYSRNIGNAFYWAVRNRNTEIINALLNIGVFDNQDIYILAISTASEIGDIETLRRILDLGVDIEGTDIGIDKAIEGGHPEVIQFLLDRGAILENNSDTLFSLSQASKKGYYEVVQFVLDRGISVERDIMNATSAIANGHLEILQLLLDRGTVIIEEFLNLASDKGYFEIVQFLLDNGARLEPINVALGQASKNGHTRIVQLLLDRGVKAEDNIVALNLASQNGHLDIVQLLLDNGAKIEHNNSAIDKASSNGNLELVHFLIERGANVENNYSSIRKASAHGHLEIVKLLIDRGATVSEFALVDASANGHLNMVEFLLDIGISPNRLAIINAVRMEHIEIFDLLFLNRKELDMPNNNIINNELLINICKNGYYDVLSYLFEFNFEFNFGINDLNLQSALIVAIKNGRKNIVKLLLNNGVYINQNHIILANKKGHRNIVRFLNDYIGGRGQS